MRTYRLGRQVGSVIMKTTYGYDVQDTNDPFLRTAEEGWAAFNEVMKQDFYFVDVFPIRELQKPKLTLFY